MNKYCDKCHNGEGDTIYPDYGVAPHECYYKKPGGQVGDSTLLPKSEWPKNFVEDVDCPGLGIYTHCLNCGAGKEVYRNIIENPWKVSEING